MHHPTVRIAYTTACVTPVVEHWLEREITGIMILYHMVFFPARHKIGTTYIVSERCCLGGFFSCFCLLLFCELISS